MDLSTAVDLTMHCDEELLVALAARFWPKVRITPACWLWTASLDAYGYGQLFNAKGLRPHRAHRLALYFANGPLPADLHVDHKCRNRACVNPDHLELVTQAENNRRAAAVREKAVICPRGHVLEIQTSRHGWRRTVCKTCRNESARARYQRRCQDAAQ